MQASGCDTAEVSLISYEDAVQTLLTHANPVAQPEQVGLKQGLGRVLAGDLVSEIDVPPAANSAMDGYAVRSADCNAGGLKIAQRIAAGESGDPLLPGTCARIFTGAPVPPDCDAVIMQEQVRIEGDVMICEEPVTTGQNIRAAGEDIRSGQKILSRGIRLRAQELGLAASVGATQLTVNRRVKVGVFFTGDELVEPGQPLAPGQIYDSNRYTLTGMLRALDCEVVDLGVVGDTLQQTRTALQRASEDTDLVITSGGVSVGEEDHVRIALEQMGQLRMWRLNIKPGKPLAFGQIGTTAFLGLPGNQVSVYATFCIFVAPFIKKLQGRSDVRPRTFRVQAAFDWPRPDRRREFARACLDVDTGGRLSAKIYPNQSSGVLMSTAWADGFVIIPENTAVSAGDEIDYFSFTDVFN